MKAVAASSSDNSENDPFASPITHPRASTFRRGRRTEGSKRRGQSEDVVKVRRPKDEDGVFQRSDSCIRRSGRRKGFSWAGSSSRWSMASDDSSRKPRKHFCLLYTSDAADE